MTTARELLRDTDLLLLDFDGPVTKLLPPPSNAALTHTLRAMALDLGVHLDADEMTTTDHLAIIRAANRHGRDALIPVEREATHLEVEAALTSPITPGIIELLALLHRRQTPIVVITNNSPECVAKFLHRHELNYLVESIIGRDPDHIDRMKPSPWMLKYSITQHSAIQAVMIGDSISDIQAANASNVLSIGLAKNPRRANEMLANGCSVTITPIEYASNFIAFPEG